MSQLPKQLTPEIITATEAYLLAKVYFTTLKESVSKVYNTVLQNFPLFADLDRKPTERIVDHEYIYLSQDNKTQTEYFKEADKQLKKRGLKPLTMGDTKCPTYPAQQQFIDAENHLIELAAPLFGLEPSQIATADMKDREQFVSLIVAAAVTSPNFKSSEEILKILKPN